MSMNRMLEIAMRAADRDASASSVSLLVVYVSGTDSGTGVVPAVGGTDAEHT